MNLVELRDFSLRRGERKVLHIPQLDIKQGEILAIVGPNGAGKSTLLLALAGLIRPQQGTLRFAGRELSLWKELDYRRQVALVLQEPLLFDLTVLENVLMGLRFRGIERGPAQQAAYQWLERLQITHLSERRAISLSGGEAQRVSLARAFVLQPQLLLLDEPFAALDPPTRAALLRDLRSLLSENQFTTVFVTHHLGEAAFLSDRLAVLIDGILRQVGTPEQIQKQPEDKAVADFVHHLTATNGIYYP